jgi:hypothetical protein
MKRIPKEAWDRYSACQSINVDDEVDEKTALLKAS